MELEALLEQTEFTLAPSAAVAYLKSKTKGKWLFICVGQHAPIATAPGKVFPIYANVEVSRKVAIKFIEDGYRAGLEARGATVKIVETPRCVFIGQQA